jgi:hypothetical protein
MNPASGRFNWQTANPTDLPNLVKWTEKMSTDSTKVIEQTRRQSPPTAGKCHSWAPSRGERRTGHAVPPNLPFSPTYRRWRI